MNTKINKPRVAKHKPRIRDEYPHPVTVRHAAPKPPVVR
jgi:hypothetical protein